MKRVSPSTKPEQTPTSTHEQKRTEKRGVEKQSIDDEEEEEE
eukprot:CAMPEP_0202711334 /NCGR_PEP_ID=MMETSP1385-20130828/23167_1 /ASSEMBLY_ACC=CAM_ASM_000861 /TAXON_ID=933848 /ORGANISM="Elphidium margaritaceum" /LENGTH=41 /DNA_ID= /DNA_START= /DNA_END= /DNA_ORIENTATION=